MPRLYAQRSFTDSRVSWCADAQYILSPTRPKIVAKTTNVEGDIHVKGTLRGGAEFQDVHGPVELRVDQWDGKRQMKLKFAGLTITLRLREATGISDGSVGAQR